MKSVAVFVSLLALVAASPVNHMNAPMHWLHMDPEERIIGGVETTIEQHPWQIALQVGDVFYCSGAIINPTHILTAAHCSDVWNYQIRAGSTSRSTGGQVIRVTDTRFNERYDGRFHDYDLTIMKLASELTFGPGVAPITLASARAPDDDKATVSGWGYTTTNGHSSDILRVVTTPIVSQESCKTSYGQDAITDRMVCAGYPEGGYDACQGDSGSPLVGTNGELVGLVSWGRGCAVAGYPGVYASIPELKDWIDANSNF